MNNIISGAGSLPQPSLMCTAFQKATAYYKFVPKLLSHSKESMESSSILFMSSAYSLTLQLLIR